MFFILWFSFIIYDPLFVPKEEQRLSLLEITHTAKSQTQKRKSDKIEKDLKRSTNMILQMRGDTQLIKSYKLKWSIFKKKKMALPGELFLLAFPFKKIHLFVRSNKQKKEELDYLMMMKLVEKL